MTHRQQHWFTARRFVAILIVVVLGVAAATAPRSWPWLREQLGLAKPEPTPGDDAPHDDHDHAEHDSAAAITLSSRGLKNVGYEPLKVETSTYFKQLRLPAMVVERPGRSQIHLTAPLTGVVTKIYSVEGEAIAEAAPLFEMRLTHEELVAAQRDYLKTLVDMEVVDREIERLQELSEVLVPGRRILERQYEKQRLQGALRAYAQTMMLHGLSEERIAQIRESKELLQYITVLAPGHDEAGEACCSEHQLTVQHLGVARGQHVEMGSELAILADHCELHVEAAAFEDDAEAIRRAAASDRLVSATLLRGDAASHPVDGLEILYVADRVDPESRALKFYLRLVNQVALDKTGPDGRHFLEWKYKPGQRMQVSVPIEAWEDQLVLPADAVVEEGAENYVFRQNGGGFQQIPVHVLLRDEASVVVANDGAIFPGDVVAGRGAYQMHLAIKNKSGGAIDPHAGHNH